MNEISERFVEAIAALEAVADVTTADAAAREWDESTLQNFWRDWPHISSWAGALWRTLSQDLEQPSTPVADHELDEVGGAG